MKTRVRLTRRNNKMCSLEAITGKVEYAPALRHDHNYTRNYIPILITPSTSGVTYRSASYVGKNYV